MTAQEYGDKIKEIADKYDSTIEVVESLAKEARSEPMQSALTERKNRLTARLHQELDALDKVFLGEFFEETPE